MFREASFVVGPVLMREDSVQMPRRSTPERGLSPIESLQVSLGEMITVPGLALLNDHP